MAILWPPRGFRYIALNTREKTPLNKDWPNESHNVEEVQRIIRQGGNYGVCPDGEQLIIDIDSRHGGTKKLFNFDVDNYYTVTTGDVHSSHRYGCLAVPLLPNQRLRKKHPNYPGVEFQTKGAYVVGPESTHPNGRIYRHDELTSSNPLKPWPAELIAELTITTSAIASGASDWSAERLEKVLEQMDPCAFVLYDDWVTLMAACHEATGGDSDAGEAFAAWSVGDPNYADHGEAIRDKWATAFRVGESGNAGEGTLLHILAAHNVKNIYCDDSAAFAPYAVKTEPRQEQKTPLQDMNDRFYVVMEDGKLRILEIRKSEDLQENGWVRHSKRDFLECCQSIYHYPNVEVKTKGADGKEKAVQVPMAQRWIDNYSVGKRTFPGGLCFKPEFDTEKVGESLNMWRGFAVEARKGSWEKLRNLIFTILCRSDSESYEYVLNWLARAVQKPGEPARTALVFKGPKGCGKGSLGRSFVRLFGIHGRHVSSMDAISGRFNSHLQDCCAMFADEAYWPGNKSHEGTFKALITEPRLHYEAKGLTPTSGRNCIHILIASNDDWVVPAGVEAERRYAVFEALNEILDAEYFNALNFEMENGGLESMLFDLLHRDITKFNVAKIPQTEALVDQKFRSMELVEQWIFKLLETENWNNTKQGVDLPILGCDLLDNFTEFIGYQAKAIRSLETQMGFAIRRFIPKARKVHIQKPAYRTDITTPRPWAYEMPDIETAKKDFSAIIGRSVFH